LQFSAVTYNQLAHRDFGLSITCPKIIRSLPFCAQSLMEVKPFWWPVRPTPISRSSNRTGAPRRARLSGDARDAAVLERTRFLKTRREESRSNCLPEPIDLNEGGIDRAEMLDQVSMAFLVVLQRCFATSSISITTRSPRSSRRKRAARSWTQEYTRSMT